MKVSVIVPVYNSEKHLRKAIPQMINQTYKDIEIILVDDASTDNSLAICREFADSDKRIKVISTEINKGAGNARNVGIDASNGEYIVFLDADDSYSKEMIEKLLRAVSQKKVDIGICGYETYVENVMSGEQDVFIPGNDFLDNQTAVRKYFTKKFPLGLVGFTCNKIFKASLLKNNDIKFPEMKRLEDGIFNIRCFSAAESCCLINEPLYHYRLSSQNEIFCKNPPTYLDLVRKLTDEFIRVQNEWGMSHLENIYRFYINETVTCIENTFSPDWNMNSAKRLSYFNDLYKDDTLRAAMDMQMSMGRYRLLAAKLLLKRRFVLLSAVVRTKIFLKKSFKSVFYFLKKKVN